MVVKGPGGGGPMRSATGLAALGARTGEGCAAADATANRAELAPCRVVRRKNAVSPPAPTLSVNFARQLLREVALRRGGVQGALDAQALGRDVRLAWLGHPLRQLAGSVGALTQGLTTLSEQQRARVVMAWVLRQVNCRLYGDLCWPLLDRLEGDLARLSLEQSIALDAELMHHCDFAADFVWLRVAVALHAADREVAAEPPTLVRAWPSDASLLRVMRAVRCTYQPGALSADALNLLYDAGYTALGYLHRLRQLPTCEFAALVGRCQARRAADSGFFGTQPSLPSATFLLTTLLWIASKVECHFKLLLYQPLREHGRSHYWAVPWAPAVDLGPVELGVLRLLDYRMHRRPPEPSPRMLGHRGW